MTADGRGAGNGSMRLPGSTQTLIDDLEARIERATPVLARGRLSQCVGTLLRASGVQPQVGELCELLTPGAPRMLAEAVGFDQGACLLTPLGPTQGLSTATEVQPTRRGHQCPVGPQLLGRVIDALGRPLDGHGPIDAPLWWPVQREPLPALQRQPVRHAMDTGIRAIDGLLTLGIGQRIGVFAPPGVGKSTLLGMLARRSSADINVVALVGERGREVRDFIDGIVGTPALERTVVVVSTSDRPAMERVKSSQVATTIAEYFRDQGRSVLLLVDSLTRIARAQREIGLACGEPPTRRSYPPSTFTMLPQLLERAGPGERGAITAVYAVLTEGDEENDPIAEEVRAIVDGHIVLSRKLAAAQHYPAIDVLNSVSRVMPQVVTVEHLADAARARGLLAKYQEVELLVQIGEYRAGSDAAADASIAARDGLSAWLRQAPDETTAMADAMTRLRGLSGRADRPAATAASAEVSP